MSRNQTGWLSLRIALLVGLVFAAAAMAVGARGDASPATEVKLSEHEGLVSPSKTVKINSPLEVRLEEVPVEEGDRVEAGALIARLNDRVPTRQVAVAKKQANQAARIAKAKASLKQARLKVKRLEKAYSSDAASEWELSKARVQREQAEASLRVARHQQASAEAELALQEARLDRYRIQAPFTGWIDRVRLSEGATLNTRTPILTLLKLNPLEAELQLPVALYGHLERGKVYRLRAGEPVNRIIEGRLTFISRSIDPGSRTFRVVFTIENPNAELPAGFPVHLAKLASVTTEQRNKQQANAK
jgi:RND family efflux transporter MFP subunit